MHYIFLPPSPASTHAHTPTLRNDFRQFLNVQSKEYWTQDNLEEPRNEASFVKRPDH